MGKRHESIPDYDHNYGCESDALIAAAQQRHAADQATPEAQRLAAEAAAEAQRDAEAQQQAGGTLAQMVRTDTGCTLTIDADRPLDTATLAAWAAAVGQPGATWTLYQWRHAGGV